MRTFMRAMRQRFRPESPAEHVAPYEPSKEIEARQNIESTPPANEALEWHVLYLGELFLPSHAPALLRGIDALGWREDDGDKRAVYEWVRRSREQGSFQGYCPVGYLVRERQGPGVQETELPEGVQHAHPIFWAITPGVTALTIQFVLDEQHGRILDEALREEHVTTTTPIPRGWRIHGPDSQKRAQLLAEAEAFRGRCEAWLTERLPGVFAAGALDGRYPALDVISTRTFAPFGPDSRGDGLFDWKGVANLDSGFDTYASENVPGLLLSFPWRPDQPHHVLTAGGKESQLLSPENLGPGHGKADRSALSSWLHFQVDDLVLAWTAQQALSAFHAALAERRDFALRLAEEPGELLTSLSQVRTALLPQWRDAQVLSTDFASLAEDVHAIPFRGLDWRRTPALDGDDVELGTALRKRCGYFARLLGETETRLRESVAADAQLATAAANLRLQRRVERLTWVSVAIALVALAGVATQVVEALSK